MGGDRLQNCQLMFLSILLNDSSAAPLTLLFQSNSQSTISRKIVMKGGCERTEALCRIYCLE